MKQMFLILSMLFLMAIPCIAQENLLGDYYVIIDTEIGKEGEVLRICHVSECEPNANELRLFKVIIVTLDTETKFYAFVNSLLEPEVDQNGDPVLDGKIRANKIDIKNLDGKKEKIDVTDVEKLINPNRSSAVHN